MRKIITLIIPAMISFTTTVNAQFSKGDVLLGGSLGFSSQVPGEDAQTTSTSFSVSPKVGFFLNEKFALGGVLGYAYNKSTSGVYPDNYLSKSSSITGGIFIRRYFSISDKLFFTLEGSETFVRGTAGSVYGIPDISPSDFYELRTRVTPLLIFMPSAHWGFEGGIGSLGYTHSHGLSTGNISNTFQLSAGNISFGVAYYFTGKTE